MSKKKETTKKTNKAVSTYILLDRSGSMASNWVETLGAINAYVEELAKDSVKGDRVTVATFDFGSQTYFDVIRDRVSHSDWETLSNDDATPRGSTPLYDAVGQMAALMEQANDKKSVLVVMTDGYENASKDVNQQGARDIVKRLADKGWETVFLGADFDAMAQAGAVGVGTGKTLNMTASNYTASMGNLAGKTRAYAGASGQSLSSAALDFTDEDRKLATEK